MFAISYIDADISHGQNAEVPSGQLGLFVQRWRELRGLRQEDLARRAGMSRSALIDIESGGGNPRYDKVIKLAEALGISERDLLGEPVEIAGKELSPRAVEFAEAYEELAQDADRDALWTVVGRMPRRLELIEAAQRQEPRRVDSQGPASDRARRTQKKKLSERARRNRR